MEYYRLRSLLAPAQNTYISSSAQLPLFKINIIFIVGCGQRQDGRVVKASGLGPDLRKGARVRTPFLSLLFDKWALRSSLKDKLSASKRMPKVSFFIKEISVATGINDQPSRQSQRSRGLKPGQA